LALINQTHEDWNINSIQSHKNKETKFNPDTCVQVLIKFCIEQKSISEDTVTVSTKNMWTAINGKKDIIPHIKET
jgi:hypothetical protein